MATKKEAMAKKNVELNVHERNLISKVIQAFKSDIEAKKNLTAGEKKTVTHSKHIQAKLGGRICPACGQPIHKTNRGE